MRLYQHRGIYHCSLSGSGNRRISLRTKDRSEAMIRANLIEKEVYADFKKIKLYITTKSYRAKKPIKKIEAKHTK